MTLHAPELELGGKIMQRLEQVGAHLGRGVFHPFLKFVRATTLLIGSAAVLLLYAPIAKADIFTSSAPSGINFGAVALNATATDDFTISTDPGYTLLGALGSGINSPFSVVIPGCHGSSCAVDESYTPTSVSSSSATLELDECPNGGGNCLGADIPLKASGFSTFENAAPSSVVAFGSVALNTTKTISFTLPIDKGYSILGALGSGINSPYSVSLSGCNGSNCAVHESYTPTSVSSSSATLEVDECPDGGGNCIGPAIKVSGTGFSVLQSSAPSSINFGTITIGKTGMNAFTVTIDKGYSLLGGLGSGINTPFSFSDSCSGTSCSVDERYAPTGSGKNTATLEIDECPDVGGACLPADIPLVGTGAPTVNSKSSPSGHKDAYAYSLASLSGTGDVFIPILDPSALVLSSLPDDAILIQDPKANLADWSAADIPANESLFDNPLALLEIPEDQAHTLAFSLTDGNSGIDGPVLADGVLIRSLVPGVAAVPEPSTWAMILLGFAGVGLAYRARRGEPMRVATATVGAAPDALRPGNDRRTSGAR